MLWEIEISPAQGQPDIHGQAVSTDAAALGLAKTVTAKYAHGYLIQGELDESQVRMLAEKLLADPVVEQFRVFSPSSQGEARCASQGEAAKVYVLPKPGVTDTAAESAKKAFRDFGITVQAVRTFKKYFLSGVNEAQLEKLCTKLLANEAIEQVVVGQLPFDHLTVGSPYKFELKTIAIRELDDSALMELSKAGLLSLSLSEMQTIRDFFVQEQRDPTDVELETLAQTWSEHCSHKTLAGRIEYTGPEGTKQFQNMLKETIFAATDQIRENWKKEGKPDLCVSVFADNAGVVRFDDEYNICFKAETHNRPSALEPYGGAHTGLGGVIRDTLGTGLGAKPICSTNVLCVAPPEILTDELPQGVLHPRRILRGAAAGARDYGNRMGVPMVNGALYFDKRYLGNPLVFCGNIGILPKDKSFKEPKPGDLIVAIGARTGRDGIHGATFSSAELTSESETLSGGAVQIGDVTIEKMMLDVILEARDRNLYNAITDCGAGGFSSAAGEMGEKIGAEVDLEKIPLKYEGLSYTEMWISEAQERMVLAVSPENWDEFQKLCESEDVETVAIGVYKPTGRLVLKYHGTQVADLSMQFLHKGRPPVVRKATYTPPKTEPFSPDTMKIGKPLEILLKILSSPNVASKHWIIRQCDHEVLSGTVIKPLVGVANDGPGDAAVVRPRLGSNRGIAVGCGMNPHYGDYDTYAMTASSIDEAVRNCVAVGADPATISILDNFCWGNTERPETLGSLVRSAFACYDVAVGLGTPFISGKDSLNNEFRQEGAPSIAIPPSLLISAMGIVDDVSKCMTMDFKVPGNVIYQIGVTKDELGGSHWALVNGLGEKRLGNAPTVDIPVAKRTFQAVYNAIQKGVVRSVHDLSEGGLVVALAESCFAGGFGAKITLPGKLDAVIELFSESNTRFLCEVEPQHVAAFEAIFKQAGVACTRLGEVVSEPKLTVGSVLEADINDLKTAWLKPLDW
ncbi:MAG: phosphoribosylformylglycinamidine synthase subunit PurL [Planctomycetaceae bacterium]|nr:phosphoribosylformylglycinamidine synthase subunit PurL [Planctomycetaceae bacterium]